MKTIGIIACPLMAKGGIKFTLIQHEIRDQFGIDNTEYCLVDLIDKMSNTREYPECVLGQVEKGLWIGVSNLKTLYNMEQKMVKLGLIVKTRTECHTTLKWREAVNFIKGKSVKITESNRQKLPNESVKITDNKQPIPISLKNKKNKDSFVGASRLQTGGEIQEANTIVDRSEFIREYNRRKLQGWRAVSGIDLVCISMGKVRVKIHNGEFVDYADDLRKIVWKKAG